MHSDHQDPAGDQGSFSAVEQAAADWLVMNDRGLNPVQQREFERWLQSDERHATVYAELAET